MKQYTIGIDFGTLSGRAVLLDCASGNVMASSVYVYPHGVMSEALPDATGLPIHMALQHPSDYLDVLKRTIPDVCRAAGVSPDEVVGLGIDFTGCTMLPVDDKNAPLCWNPQYEGEPHAYVKLWKDHSAQTEADKITRLAEQTHQPWLEMYGGKVSSEWMIPKILKICKEAPELYHETARFMEAGDWLYKVLTGSEIYSVSFAGYKACWNEENGFPSSDFFATLHPDMRDLIGIKLSTSVVPIDHKDGMLSPDGARLTGLREGIAVAAPILDAHASMPALGIVDEGALMLILGTSSVHLAHSRKKIEDIRGICGYVPNAVIPSLYTYEAGQACCGDHFDWFVKNSVPMAYAREAEQKGMGIHRFLREKAKALKPGESGLLALDWFNGNRSVLSDGELKGMILGMTLRTKPEEIYRALIEATAYGTRMILETFENSELKIERIIASGGIAEKDEMMMQIYADVIRRPITVSDAKFSASCGSAMYAAVAAGLFPTIADASEHLSVRTGKTYYPIEENVWIYDRLYEEYKILHDYFGRGGNDVMKRLSKISDKDKETDQ